MRDPRRILRTTTVSAVATAVLVCTGVGLAPAVAGTATHHTASESGTASGIRFVDIEGDGGVTLKANVVAPAGASSRAERSYPLVVLPTSWALPQVEYLAQARKLADSGYVVVSYNVRGFWQSGGEIEVAGRPDIADASKVIDWALANTPADRDRVGMGGVSYGAGISLLASASDKRIKAVAALSGWADLVGSIYSGRTQHVQAAGLLGLSGALTGRPSEELKSVLHGFLTSDLSKEKEMIEWGRKRSPITRLDAINRNGPAIMMGNAWGDTIFPPNQYADFYEKLTVPKRLEFRPGDHATGELTGLFGLPNDTWTSAHRWFDHHLKGEDNGVERERPVRIKSRTDGKYESYESWRAVGSAHRELPLDGSEKVVTGRDSGANGGIVLLSNALDQFLRQPPAVSLPLLPPSATAIWKSERSKSVQRLRGTAKLHTTVAGDKSSGTFMTYLYDVGPLGTGKLVTSAPYTFHDREPGKTFSVDLEMFSTAYDVPAGHRLALVIDTVDPLYAEHNPSGAELTFSSPSEDPSRLTLPLREE